MKGIRKEDARSALIGIAIVVCLAVFAIAVPHWVMEQMNRRTLEQKETFSFSLTAYQNSYGDFGEELDAMARSDVWEEVYLMDLLSNREVDDLTRSQLTEALNQELTALAGQGVFGQPVAMQEDMLASCALYSLYAMEEDNALNGILLWHLVYEDEENGTEAQFVLEGTFRKICFLKMYGEQTAESGPALSNEQTERLVREAIAAYYQPKNVHLYVKSGIYYDAYDGVASVSKGGQDVDVKSSAEEIRDTRKTLPQPEAALLVCYEWIPKDYYVEFGILSVHKIMWE